MLPSFRYAGKTCIRLLHAAGSDTRLVFRDPLLAILPFSALLASLALRFVLPVADQFLESRMGFAFLADYGLLIRAVLIGFPGMFFGMIAGFLILDDRDEGILKYQEATPLGRSGYLIARLGFFFLCAFAIGPVCGALSGFGNVGMSRLGTEIAVSFIAAFQVPFYALFLGAFAANKVEGLSIAKALGVMDLAPLALIAPGAFRFLGIPCSQYWGVAILYRPPSMAGTGLFPYALPAEGLFLAGFAIAIAQTILLYSAFAKRLE